MFKDFVLQRKIFWAVAGALALFLTVVSLLAVRSYQRAEIRKLLNEQIAFSSPAVEITFPRLVADDPASRELLEPGAQIGLWSVELHQANPDFLEVRVTDRGRQLFSPVGNQIIATFITGHREVTRILGFTSTSGGRSVRFRYYWNELHQGIRVLGIATPEIGKEYEGEALLVKNNGGWRVAYWNTPQEEAVARFRQLQSR